MISRTKLVSLSSVLIVLSLSALLPACQKEEQKLTSRDIYLYQAPDRDQKLIAGGKKEGVVNIYTSMSPQDAEKLIGAFEEKYAIKVALWRAFSDKIIQRVLIEAKAGRYDVDLIEMNGRYMETLYREKITEEFYSPALQDMPPEILPSHKHYIPDRVNPFVMAYNTKLIKAEDLPNSYEDLLNRKWNGKLGLIAGDVDWFASIVKEMGEEKGLAYFKKLAAMHPMMRRDPGTLPEMVASGEVPIGLNAYLHIVERVKKKGGAVDWKPLPPTFGRPGVIGLSKNAPHPYAALLFADFVLSKEGQEIIRERGRVPTSKAVDSPVSNTKYAAIDPAIILDEWDKWAKLWSELFLGGKALEREEER